MSNVPFADRVVEVIADRGEGLRLRYRYGSGCIVAGRMVLTAGHVVDQAIAVTVRLADKLEVPARVDAAFIVVTAGLDLALVELDDQTVNVAPIPIARIDRDLLQPKLVERVQAVGYPQFMERPVVGRETAHVAGHIPVLAGLVSGLLSLQITSAPRPVPPASTLLQESEWSGMSGAPVLAAGQLIGVVSEHAPREGESSLTVVPLTMLSSNAKRPLWGAGVVNTPEWWRRLGVADPDQLSWLPKEQHARATPEYWATIREVHGRTPQLLQRQAELADLAAFATGPSGYRWLVANAWAGKTALLAEAVVAALPAEVDVVAYFASRREADADGNRFLTAVVPQLEHLLGEPPFVADRHRFRYLWERANERAVQTDRELLLLVDGLDEDLRPPGVPSIASQLPTVLGTRGHVLVASRPHPEIPVDVDASHPLRLTRQTLLPPSEEASQVATLAHQELHNLLQGDHSDLATDVLGLLAAAGPLTILDVATLAGDLAPPNPRTLRKVRRLLTEEAARSLQPVGQRGWLRYAFAHSRLFEQAQADPDLSHPEYSERIHRWAKAWAKAGWPLPAGQDDTTPRYLLDTYPATLKDEPERLIELASDIGWLVASLHTVGVDQLLADLSAVAAAPRIAAYATLLRSQSSALRRPHPIDDPVYLLRQLCWGAMELAQDDVAASARARLQGMPKPGPVPLWTTRRVSQAIVSEFSQQASSVTAIGDLPGGRIASGCDDGRILVWDAAAPAVPLELAQHPQALTALAGLPDGQLATGSADGRVSVWEQWRSEWHSRELGRHDGAVCALAATSDGRIVSCGADGVVLSWDPSGRDAASSMAEFNYGYRMKYAEKMEFYRSRYSKVALIPQLSGDILVAAISRTWPTNFAAWADIPQHGQIEFGIFQDANASAIGISPDGFITCGDADGRVLAWDLSTPENKTEVGRHGSEVSAMAATPDGQIVSGGRDGRILLWNQRMPESTWTELGRHEGSVVALAAMKDGRVISSARDGRILVWDPLRPGVVPTGLSPHADRAAKVAMTRDARLISGSPDGRLKLWDPFDGSLTPTDLGSHGDRIYGMAVSAGGRLVTAGGDQRIVAWNLERPGSAPVELGEHAGRVVNVVAMSDGRVVTAGVTGRMRVWDTDRSAAGATEAGPEGRSLRAVTLGPHDRVITAGRFGRLVIWDSTANQATQLVPADPAVIHVAAAPNGAIVTGGDDGLVLLWTSSPLAQRVQLCRHSGEVLAVSVAANGWVASVGGDRRVVFCDPADQGSRMEITCSASAITFAPEVNNGLQLFALAHVGQGLSVWAHS